MTCLAPPSCPVSYVPQMQPNGNVEYKLPDKIEDALPQHSTFKDLCETLNNLVTEFLNSEQSTPLLRGVQEQTRIAVQVCEDALQRYTLKHLSISYNGGKDCLVLLIVYLVALHRHCSKRSNADSLPATLESIYIQPGDPFDEVTQFVDTSAKHYRLSLYTSSKPMKEAFQEYLDKHKDVQAIFVGTRRTDPHGKKLTHFDATDGGWPQFMRIHPVIDWHYAEIWAFLRRFEIPYCTLYDNGFTSLGGINDTKPNPALKVDGEHRYRPAYDLIEDDAERLGRNKS